MKRLQRRLRRHRRRLPKSSLKNLRLIENGSRNDLDPTPQVRTRDERPRLGALGLGFAGAAQEVYQTHGGGEEGQ